MNFKLFLFATFLALGCGGIVAQFYPYSFGGESKEETKEEKRYIEEAVFDDLSIRDVVTGAENGSPDDICEYIFFILKDQASKGQVYAMPIMEHFVRETPGQAVASMKGEFFRDQERTYAAQYVRLFFTSLGKFYPHYFSVYFKYLNEDSSERFAFNATAMDSFFEQLAMDDPKIAYDMLTGGGLEELKSYANISDDDWGRIISQNRELALSCLDGGLSEAFLLELKSNGARGRMSFFLQKNLTKENHERVFDWMADNLGDDEKSFYFRQMINWISKLDLDETQLLAMTAKIHSIISSPWDAEYMARTLAIRNSELALDFIEKNLTGESRERSLAAVLKELNKTRSIDEMKEMVGGLSSGMCKREILPVVFTKYYKESPDEAVAWYIEQQDNPSTVTWNLSNRSGLNADIRTEQGAELFARFARSSDDENLLDNVSRTFVDGNTQRGEMLISELEGEKQEAFASRFYNHFMRKDFEKAKKSFESNGSISGNSKIREAFERFEKEKSSPPDGASSYSVEIREERL